MISGLGDRRLVDISGFRRVFWSGDRVERVLGVI